MGQPAQYLMFSSHLLAAIMHIGLGKEKEKERESTWAYIVPL